MAELEESFAPWGENPGENINFDENLEENLDENFYLEELENIKSLDEENVNIEEFSLDNNGEIIENIREEESFFGINSVDDLDCPCAKCSLAGCTRCNF